MAISKKKKKKKLKNLPKSAKNLEDFITFFLKIWGFFSKEFPSMMLLVTFLYSKMVNFCHQKNH
jgi:hypothetical protein